MSKIPGLGGNAARDQSNVWANIKMMTNVPMATIEQKQLGELYEIETTAENKGCQISKASNDGN